MRFLWFRAFMMTVSLVFVIIAIRKLNNGVLSPNVASVVGLPASPQTSVSIKGSLNWCETRVEALTLADGTEVRQEKFKWFRVTPSGRQELDFVAVEKWLAHHCTVSTELTRSAENEIPARLLKVTFIKGNPQTLLRYPTGEFAWAGQTFKSTELAGALEDLKALPPARR